MCSISKLWFKNGELRETSRENECAENVQCYYVLSFGWGNMLCAALSLFSKFMTFLHCSWDTGLGKAFTFFLLGLS